MNVKELLARIILERDREDKHFVKLEFNIRGHQVVMNYIYDHYQDEDIHSLRHDADPEILDLETFEELKNRLCEEKVPFQVRRDEFL